MFKANQPTTTITNNKNPIKTTNFFHQTNKNQKFNQPANKKNWKTKQAKHLEGKYHKERSWRQVATSQEEETFPVCISNKELAT